MLRRSHGDDGAQPVPQEGIIALVEEIPPVSGRLLAVAGGVSRFVPEKKVYITLLRQVEAVPLFTAKDPLGSRESPAADGTDQGRGIHPGHPFLSGKLKVES